MSSDPPTRSFLLLLALLLCVLQCALSVDAKGGGKSSGSKNSKQGSKSKSKSQPVVYHDNGRCYDERYATRQQYSLSSSFLISLPLPSRVQIQCPTKSATVIASIVVGVICGNTKIFSCDRELRSSKRFWSSRLSSCISKAA